MPIKPVKPQSELETQFNSEFLHSLISVPGLMHSSFVKGLKSSQSESSLQIIPLHYQFKQISLQTSKVLASFSIEQKLSPFPGLLHIFVL